MDMCRVALGSAAIYAEYDLKPWDVAAAKVIVESAGCVFEQRDGVTLCGSRSAIMRFDGETEATGEDAPGDPE